MDAYTARLNNAIRIAEKIKGFLASGYIVRNDSDEKVLEIIIDHTEPSEITYRMSENCCAMLFSADRDRDDGMHTNISDFNKQFDSWCVFKPSKIIDW